MGYGIKNFIKKAKEIHGNKYDYSKVKYINNHTLVNIICPEHGEFKQIPQYHLDGCGCQTCAEISRRNKRRKNNEQFIKQAQEVHGDKYDYSKTEYKNAHTKVCIICPEHGEFLILPGNHLKGQGCKKCANDSLRKSKEIFLKELCEIYGNKYNYSKVNYINSRTKVCIICPEHGEFWQTPASLINGYSCPYCSNYRMSKEQFIERARKVHGDKYDYSKVEYKNAKDNVCIICPEHGEFWQTPYNHLFGCCCPKCSGLKKLTTEEFIERARKVHGDKYDYSKVEYINTKTKVCIICPKHGEFWIKPNHHLSKKAGCYKCHEEKRKFYKLKSTEEFIKQAQEIHGNKYDYSKTEYKGNNIKVCIICPEHGEFWQTPGNHLKYKGCPICKTSHLQKKIRNFLIKNNINFEEEKILPFFKDGKSHKSVDFYLPDYGVAIECQGIQHFEPTNFGGKLSTEEMNINYKKQIESDRIKKELCDKNGIKLIYYSELEIIFPYNVIKNKRDLLKEILNN